MSKAVADGFTVGVGGYPKGVTSSSTSRWPAETDANLFPRSGRGDRGVDTPATASLAVRVSRLRRPRRTPGRREAGAVDPTRRLPARSYDPGHEAGGSEVQLRPGGGEMRAHADLSNTAVDYRRQW